ncbi:MAG: hypothetical protein E7351_02990 [Clostridiales bacterium]|nr:hypothetical protein [Clostridiales bacterium]
MTKELKKCYQYLDLPYDADEEQILTREKVLIKILHAKALEKGVSYDKKVDKIVKCTNIIMENIKNNGIPKENRHYFENSFETIISLIFAFILVGIVCVVSFITLL